MIRRIRQHNQHRFGPASLALAALVAIPIGGGAVFLATEAQAAINSNLTIDPAQTFVLGGGQRGAFTVTGTNNGSVAVEVLARADGQDSPIATVEPGADFEQNFAAYETALLRNTSATAPATLKVRITGSTGNLGMSYQPNE